MPYKNHVVITGGIGLIAVVLAVSFISAGNKSSDILSADISSEKESQSNGDMVTNTVIPIVTQKMVKNVTMSPLLSPTQSFVASIAPTVSPTISPTRTTTPSIPSSTTKVLTPTPMPTKTPSPSLSPTPSLSPSPSPSPTETHIPTPTPSPSSSVAPTLSPMPTDIPGDTSPPSVVFSEIAWMGTQASSADEWIELFNVGTTTADMTGWKIQDGDGNTVVSLSGVVDAGSYFLIERTDQQTISDITAQIAKSFGGGGLNDNDSANKPGEKLILLDSMGSQVDVIDCLRSNNGIGWFSGDKSTRSSMERKNASGDSNNPANWGINNGIIRNGADANTDPINGTPGARNSVSVD